MSQLLSSSQTISSRQNRFTQPIKWMTHEALIRWSAVDSLPQDDTFLPKTRDCQIKGQVWSFNSGWDRSPDCGVTRRGRARPAVVRPEFEKFETGFEMKSKQVSQKRQKRQKQLCSEHATIRVTISRETFLCAVDILILGIAVASLVGWLVVPIMNYHSTLSKQCCKYFIVFTSYSINAQNQFS